MKATLREEAVFRLRNDKVLAYQKSEDFCWMKAILLGEAVFRLRNDRVLAYQKSEDFC